MLTIFSPRVISSLSDHMKTSIGDNLDDFITQIVSPNDTQMHLAVEQNQLVVNELKNFMFTVYNQFLFGSSEMLENYMKHRQMRSSQGSTHSEYFIPRVQRNGKQMLKNKVITIRMNFRFEDIFDPNNQNQRLLLALDSGRSRSKFLGNVIQPEVREMTLFPRYSWQLVRNDGMGAGGSPYTYKL